MGKSSQGRVRPPIQRTARNHGWSGTLVTFAPVPAEARKGNCCNSFKGRNLIRGTLPKGQRTAARGNSLKRRNPREHRPGVWLTPERLRTDSEREQTPEASSLGINSPGRGDADPDRGRWRVMAGGDGTSREAPYLSDGNALKGKSQKCSGAKYPREVSGEGSR